MIFLLFWIEVFKNENKGIVFSHCRASIVSYNTGDIIIFGVKQLGSASLFYLK